MGRVLLTLDLGCAELAVVAEARPERGAGAGENGFHGVLGFQGKIVDGQGGLLGRGFCIAQCFAGARLAMRF